MRLPKEPAKGDWFCRITSDVVIEGLLGAWSGSEYRHHPRGVFRDGLICTNERNINDYCWAAFMTEPGAEIIPPENHPRSRGPNVYPRPKQGTTVIFYRNGVWVGEQGPWRNDLWKLMFDVESELEDRKLAAEWERKISAIDLRREERQRWESLRNQGWNLVEDGLPARGTRVEILHFGGQKGLEIRDTAIVDEYGVKPDASDGGHGKRSTVTHWRLLAETAIR